MSFSIFTLWMLQLGYSKTLSTAKTWLNATVLNLKVRIWTWRDNFLVRRQPKVPKFIFQYFSAIHTLPISCKHIISLHFLFAVLAHSQLIDEYKNNIDVIMTLPILTLCKLYYNFTQNTYKKHTPTKFTTTKPKREEFVHNHPQLYEYLIITSVSAQSEKNWHRV